MNGHKLGLTLGTFSALIHALWSILVAIGWAQPLSDFIHWLHFLGNTMTILPFNFGQAILLIVIAFIAGYALGGVFALLWNKFHKMSGVSKRIL